MSRDRGAEESLLKPGLAQSATEAEG